MPRYDVACPVCGVQEIVRAFRTPAEEFTCPVCERPRPRLIVVPYFQEDRTRFFRGAQGDGYSFALGEPMPGTRRERDALAARKGVEFVGRAEFLADNREAAEALAYRQEVDAGGAREPWQPARTDAFVAAPAWAEALR